MYKKYIVKISINILKNEQETGTGNRKQRQNDWDHSTSNTTRPQNKQDKHVQFGQL